MSEADARRAADEPDDNAPDIPPALTPSEWMERDYQSKDSSLTRFLHLGDGRMRIDGPHGYVAVRAEDDFAALIALLNDDLHDEDVRKITREHVELLREAAKLIEIADPIGRGTGIDIDRQAEIYSELLEFADVIDSYLPPDPAIDREPFKNETPLAGFPPLPPAM